MKTLGFRHVGLNLNTQFTGQVALKKKVSKAHFCLKSLLRWSLHGIQLSHLTVTNDCASAHPYAVWQSQTMFREHFSFREESWAWRDSSVDKNIMTKYEDLSSNPSAEMCKVCCDNVFQEPLHWGRGRNGRRVRSCWPPGSGRDPNSRETSSVLLWLLCMRTWLHMYNPTYTHIPHTRTHIFRTGTVYPISSQSPSVFLWMGVTRVKAIPCWSCNRE